MKPLVIILMGSKADMEHCTKISEACKGFGLDTVLRIGSANKTPEHAVSILNELVNSAEMRNELMGQGVGFSSSSDTEVMTMMLARNGGATWEERIKTAMKKWVGAYSLVILTRDCVYAVRDPWGFRPLCIGLLPSGGHAVASETGALQTLGCEAIRDVKPGEVVSLSNSALKVMQAVKPVQPSAMCIFEHIYFARPDQTWDGINVHQVRQRLGDELAREVESGFLKRMHG